MPKGSNVGRSGLSRRAFLYWTLCGGERRRRAAIYRNSTSNL